MRIVIGLLIAMFGAIFQGPAPSEADEMLAQLSKIRLDKKQVHVVRELTIRRDALSITLNRGAIAFLEPVNGRVTGAVFIGSGEVVAIPPDRIERQQISRFTGSPILNEPFQTALFRFSDGTYEEITREISQRAEEEVSAEEITELEAWDTALATRSPALNLRLLADFLEPAGKPFFLGELNAEKHGWFDVLFDTRAAEEVSVFQIRTVGARAVADVWASFNQRSEARTPEAVAHEYKSGIDIISYEIDGTGGPGNQIEATLAMRIKARDGGARVLNFDLPGRLRLASIRTDTDEPLSYYQYPETNSFFVVLPQSLKPGQELTLRLVYAGEAAGLEPWYPSQRQSTIPAFKSNLSRTGQSATRVEYGSRNVMAASYHDQWLLEGLSRYLPVMPSDAALRQLLDTSRDELKTVESTGPIWLGRRLISTISPDAGRAVYGKSVWVIHMLRMMLKQNVPDPDSKFLALLQEFAETYDGKAASTWDFKRLAEQRAGEKLDWFFDQWVFGTGLPSYSLDYKIEASGNEFTVEGTITQTGVPDGFVMPVPLYADAERLGTVQVEDSEGQFNFRLSRKPERVIIDPEMTILTETVP